MPLYKFLHNLLNVLVQIANKMELQNEEYLISSCRSKAKMEKYQQKYQCKSVSCGDEIPSHKNCPKRDLTQSSEYTSHNFVRKTENRRRERFKRKENILDA
jgi:hypothetical protein